MTISALPKNKIFEHPSQVPMDFYSFKHRQKLVKSIDRKTKLAQPLWIVGVSPFDEVISPDDGHVVHLGTPKFTAKWTTSEETMSKIIKPDYFDEDLYIMIYETIAIGKKAGQMEEWFLEAACAVAYSKGMICVMDDE